MLAGPCGVQLVTQRQGTPPPPVVVEPLPQNQCVVAKPANALVLDAITMDQPELEV